MSGIEFALAGGAIAIVEADRLLPEAMRPAVRVSKRTLDRIETMAMRVGTLRMRLQALKCASFPPAGRAGGV
mgnify:CR=1 FL=1